MNNNWHTLTEKEILDYFKTTRLGLSDTAVKENQEKFGLNEFSKTKKITYFSIFISQFKSAFIYILIVAALIVLFLGEVIDAGIIFGIILVNAIIGTLQEGKARNTFDALKKAVEGKAMVMRDGKPRVILDKDVVPGDILILRGGDHVTADARLIDCNSFSVNESSLTGESESVSKEIKNLSDPDTPVADRDNMVFKGTFVISGFAEAIVVGTGKDTEIGKIAEKLDELHSDVPLKQNIKNLSKIIIVLVSIISAIIFFVGIRNGNSGIEMFKTVVAVAVSAIPESLPVVVTLVLASGVWRMSKKNVLVKRLQAVESLGQASILALDKTGTITKNQMMVSSLYLDGKIYEVTGKGYEPKGELTLDGEQVTLKSDDLIHLACKVSAFTATSKVIYSEENKDWEALFGDPTEAASLVFAEKMGVSKEELEKEYPKVFEIPFDFDKKYHLVINDIGKTNMVSVLGSSENVLKHCTDIFTGNKKAKLTDAKLKELEDVIIELSSKGNRVLAMAMRECSDSSVDPDDLPGLTFLGFMCITDAIRPDVSSAIALVKGAGMKVVMITGDHTETAKAIAIQIGIYEEGDKVLSGRYIETLDIDQLADKLDDVTVFSRVSPEAKLKIIQAYKKRGEIIAMTGDGINDALPLVAADLGVSMGKIGTEVAKESSDLILLDDNFGNIAYAAEEGRNIYQTIRKSILYLLSTNFGEMSVIAVAVIIGLPLPLLATQILWLNMITDTFLVAALAMEPKEKGLMKERFVKTSNWFVDRFMALRIILIGSVMTIGTLIMFIIYLDESYIKAITMALSILTVFQWYNIFNIRSDKKSIFTENPFRNKYLIIGLFVAIGLHMYAIYNPFMQGILHTTALSLSDWSIIMLAALPIIVVEEVRKMFYRMLTPNSF